MSLSQEHEAKIKADMQAEMQQFMDNPWEAILPDWFLITFKEVVMHVPQNVIRWRPDQLQSIITKQQNDLGFEEVGIIANVMACAEPKYIHKDLYQFVIRRVQIDNIRRQWEERKAAEEKRLFKKTQNLAKIMNNVPTIHKA